MKARYKRWILDELIRAGYDVGIKHIEKKIEITVSTKDSGIILIATAPSWGWDTGKECLFQAVLKTPLADCIPFFKIHA